MTNRTVRKAGRFTPHQELNRKFFRKVVHKPPPTPTRRSASIVKMAISLFSPALTGSDNLDPSRVGWTCCPSVALRAMEGCFWTSRNQKERPAGEGRARRHQELGSTGIFWREELQIPQFRGKNKAKLRRDAWRSGRAAKKKPRTEVRGFEVGGVELSWLRRWPSGPPPSGCRHRAGA